MANAGRDISHWFDTETGQPRTYFDAETGLTLPDTGKSGGRYLHIPPPATPSNDLDCSDYASPWWSNEEYVVGLVSKAPMKLRVVNTLTGGEHLLEVPGEETVEEIQNRYLEYNNHAKSYTWKRLGSPLDMSVTLADNGIEDDSEAFLACDLPEDSYVPAVHLYYNDDLTVM